MSNKPTHNVYVTEKYTNDSGVEKHQYTNIGSAWILEKGGFSCELRAGLAVSGRFVIFPKKEK